jgi:hypothetical protein
MMRKSELIELAKKLSGKRVRFNHEADGWHEVVAVSPDGMIELHDLGGWFAPHLFTIVEPERKVVEIHDRHAGEIVKRIVRLTLDAGGDITDVLALLESVVTGVLTVAVKRGGDQPVLDVFIEGVHQRMAQVTLGNLPTQGRAL